MTGAPPLTATTLTPEQVRDYAGPPLLLFVGISTGGSGVHATYPRWAPLFAPGSVLRGIDLPEDADPERFRALLRTMAANPAVRGAVVTSHKLRLHRAGRELFDGTEPVVDLTHEVNSLDTRNGIRAFARDPQSLDAVLDQTVGDRPTVCIGSGGSAIALLLATQLDIAATLRTGRPVVRPDGSGRGPLTIVGRDPDALAEVRDVLRRCGLTDRPVRLVHAPSPDELRRTLATALPGTAVINATGLGKTAPGSPLPDPDCFPADALAWDFNYRGPLTFLDQARAAGIPAVDGWDYFVAGWSAALAAITDRDLTPELLDAALAAARPLAPANTQ